MSAVGLVSKLQLQEGGERSRRSEAAQQPRRLVVFACMEVSSSIFDATRYSSAFDCLVFPLVLYRIFQPQSPHSQFAAPQTATSTRVPATELSVSALGTLTEAAWHKGSTPVSWRFGRNTPVFCQIL